jgi:mono/diheme cytochrome c family protein
VKRLLPLCLLPFLLLAGCTREGQFQPVSMWNRSRLKPLEPSPMPGQLSSSRELPPGTVAQGQLWRGDPLLNGRENGKLVTKSPVPVTRALIERGQQRFNIYCSPCHGMTGNGQGMIVKRGFPPPPDYAIARLRKAADGHFFDVITNGYGVMYSYADRVAPHDRWAIAAYIRVLQASRKDTPEEQNRQLRIRARETGIGTRPTPPER